MPVRAARKTEKKTSAEASPESPDRPSKATAKTSAKPTAKGTAKPTAAAAGTSTTTAPRSPAAKGSPKKTTKASEAVNASPRATSKTSAGAVRNAPKPAKGRAKPRARAASPKPPRKTPQEIATDWATRLGAERPGLVEWVLDRLSEYYGKPVWHQTHDPTSQLVLTMLSANSADTNAEVAFEALRDAYAVEPLPDGADRTPQPRDGWGGKGIADLPPPDWHRVETAPLDELIDVIRPGGLGPQKAPRIQAALSALHDQAGGHSLEFLGQMEALEARQWMTQIPGIGPKTASVVLLFAYGLPLMPVDRHVERVSLRVGMLPPKVTADQAHEDFLALVPPDRMYECHVDLIRHGRSICHAQRPECGRCPIAERCRYLNRDAP